MPTKTLLIDEEVFDNVLYRKVYARGFMKGYGEGMKASINAIRKNSGDVDLDWINTVRLSTKTKLGEGIKKLSKKPLTGEKK